MGLLADIMTICEKSPVNNFENIEPYLEFYTPGDFYFIQIIQRKKDNPDIERNMNVINTYFVYDQKKYWDLQDRIIHECNAHNARAYINLNVRNAQDIAFQTLKLVTDYIVSKDYKAVKNAYVSACGRFNSEENQRWIVDIDGQEDVQKIMSFITELHNHYTQNASTPYRILGQIPTKNGTHIITNPFPISHFKYNYPKIDIHKDNPTALFVP